MRPEPAPEPLPEPEPFSKREFEPFTVAPREEQEPEVVKPVVKAPAFLTTEPKRSRRWLTVAISLLLGLGIGAVAYQRRETWFAGLLHSGSGQSGYTGLQTVDLDGQLQIRWDRNSAAVQGAREAILTIQDGGAPLAIELDKEHLQAGSFTYGRQGEKVDISLALRGPDGQVTAREASTYLGKLPNRVPPAEDPQVRKQRDDLEKQADSLSKDLKEQQVRTQKLEKSLEDTKTELQREQRKRMQNQVPDK
jgi:hypothetical protein